MKSRRWVLVLFVGLFLFGCAKGGTYSLHLRYEPAKELPSVQQKMGPALGLAEFKDLRPDTLYIGMHMPVQGVASYFKSEPFPLEKAIRDSLSQVLSRKGIKIVPVASWDGRPESLKNLETDSVLSMEIKQFWTGAKAGVFRTDVTTRISFVLHLGIKREAKVFTRNVEIEKEMTVPNWEWDREKMERTISQILTESLDNFLSNPY